MSTPPRVEVVEHERHVDAVAGAEQPAEGGGGSSRTGTSTPGGRGRPGPRPGAPPGCGTRGRSSPRARQLVEVGVGAGRAVGVDDRRRPGRRRRAGQAPAQQLLVGGPLPRGLERGTGSTRRRSCRSPGHAGGAAVARWRRAAAGAGAVPSRPAGTAGQAAGGRRSPARRASGLGRRPRPGPRSTSSTGSVEQAVGRGGGEAQLGRGSGR